MTCKKYRDLMAGAALGDLPETEQINFERHLAGCDSCRGEYHRMRLLTRTLNSAPTVSLSEVDRLRLENAVYRRLAEPTLWQKYGRNPMPRKLIRIAAAVVLVGLGYFAHPLLSGSSKPDPAIAAPPATSTLAVYQRDFPSGSRFTGAGFKAIAYGRKAALEQYERAGQTQTNP